MSWLWETKAFAQDSSDSVSVERFFEMVEKHHPILRQSRLLPSMADAKMQVARGAFDPKLGFEHDQKQFKGKEYYHNVRPSLKIPTFPGLDLKVDYQSTEGEFLNPERSLPDDGLVGLGVSVPIGRNLLMDARRAQWQKAKLMGRLNEAERIKLANKLRLKATLAYIEWYRAHRQLGLQREALEQVRQQADFVNQLIRIGETAGIDSVKAATQLGKQQIATQEAELLRRNARLRAEVYLWQEDGSSEELPDAAKPMAPFTNSLDAPTEDAVDTLRARTVEAHPELRKLRTKQEQIEVDRRMALENLKPLFRVDFTWLNGPTPGPSEWSTSTLDEEFKLEVGASFPLFLRKERGKLNLSNLKLLETRYLLQQTEREVEADLNTYINEWRTLETQIARQRQLVDSYQQLLEAEREKFRVGESDLLLVNLRIQQWVESRQKLVDLLAKRIKARCYTLYAAGLPPTWPYQQVP